MKCLNRCLALFLCVIMILNVPNKVFAVNSSTSSEDVQIYSIPIISNEYDGSHITFYGIDGKYYLSFDDIKELARFKLDETDTTITLTQGLRELVIEKSSGHLVDCDFVDQGNIDIIQYDGKYLCEGIPMLIYLGAACALKENQVLEVMMPTVTIWESIMPNYLDYYFNITELYGGEDNVKIKLVCDVLSDVLDGVSGHGLFANGDTHLEDALYEILNVDIMKYEAVQELITVQNQSVNEFLVSEGLSAFLDGSSLGIDSVSKLLNYYADFYLDGEILKNDVRWQRSYSAGDLDGASSLSKKINQKVYEQSAIKANLANADNIGDALDHGMIALDTAIVSYKLMQYDDDTRNLFSRTINEDIFRYAGYDDISWNNISDKISKNLSSSESIVQSAALDSVVDYVSDEITENGVKAILSTLTSKANIYVAATQLATFVASLINYNTNQAFSADMNAIWLSTVQHDIAQLTSRMLVKERDEYHFSDAESLTKLKDMFTLYYRTIIAFSENITKSIEEFGGKNRNEWMQYFGGISGKSVCNYAAIYLYRITNCTVVPIVDYAGKSDTLMKADWIKKYKIRQDSERGNSIGNISNGGLVAQSGDWIYYQHTNDGFKLYKMRADGSEKTKLNDNISYCINVVEDWIYYINNSDIDASQCIYKMRTDGSENTKLNDSMSEDINVIGDWIYYKKYCGNGDWKLHKLAVDGSQEIMLYDRAISDFCVTNDWIYFTDYEGGGDYSLCKIRTNGSGKTKLINEYAYDINIEGDWIYYTIGGLEDKVIRKIRTDGTDETKVNRDGSFYMNVIGGWIYYSNWNDGNKLYKIRTDGSQNTKLTDDECVNIHIIDDWIYYTIDFGNGELYRIRKDGTDRQIIAQ